MKRRASNIELWRCVCMFAVVLGHVIVNNNVAPMNAFFWHIPGFLLISGYFGIRFSFWKILKLFGVVYGCFWLTIPLRSGGEGGSLWVPHGGWFFPFYLVLMLISPVFNAAFLSSISRRLLLGIVMASLLIGWIPTIPGFSCAKMMCVPGFQGNGILLMMAIYLIGRLIKEYDLSKKGRWEIWCACFVGCIFILAMPCLRFLVSNSYASPFVIITSVFGFVTFLHFSFEYGRFSRLINLISPSMFGVYILHECCIRKYQYISESMENRIFFVFVLSIILFLGCV